MYNFTSRVFFAENFFSETLFLQNLLLQIFEKKTLKNRKN